MFTHPLFETLWTQYSALNPHAKTIHQLLIDEGETIVNDHIAIRTCRHPMIHIGVLAKYFEDIGYEAKDCYDFPQKKLKAQYLEHPDPSAPKIFISELLVKEFERKVQILLNECINQVDSHATKTSDFLSSGIHWGPLDYEKYQYLREHSEYAAWFYAFGFCANHFTVNINNLKKYSDIISLNTFLKRKGFTLNSSGGEVKGSPEEHLEQSSTMASSITLPFVSGEIKISSCYYEFAKRYPLANGKLFQGFVTNSADKIFESTNPEKDNR
jgi:hypothetical protein